MSVCAGNIFCNFVGYLGTSSTDTVEIKIACKYSCFFMTCLTFSKNVFIFIYLFIFFIPCRFWKMKMQMLMRLS